MEFSSSRRGFLATAGTAWLAAAAPGLAAAARAAERVASGLEPPAYQVLSAADAALVEALTARIVPSEGPGPGAREARVVVFVDRVLAGVFAEQRQPFQDGLREFAAAFAESAGEPFAAAAPERQDEFIGTREHTAFFGLAQTLTAMGMVSAPAWGGNAGGRGWALIGFEDRHAFAPPFGHYDRDYPGFEAVARRYRKPASRT